MYPPSKMRSWSAEPLQAHGRRSAGQTVLEVNPGQHSHVQSMAEKSREELAELVMTSQAALTKLTKENKLLKLSQQGLKKNPAWSESPRILAQPAHCSSKVSSTKCVQPLASTLGFLEGMPLGHSARAVPDIVRNLKATNQHIRQERDCALRELKAVQQSMRATRVAELERLQKVLVDEVDRLNQISSVLREQGSAQRRAFEIDMGRIRADAEVLVQERRECICMRTAARDDGGGTRAVDPKAQRRRARSKGGPKEAPRALQRAHMAHDVLMVLLAAARRVLVADAPSYGTAGKQEKAEATALVNALGAHVERFHSDLHQLQLLARLPRSEHPVLPPKPPARNRVGGVHCVNAGAAMPLHRRLLRVQEPLAALVEALRALPPQQFLADTDILRETRALGRVVAAFVQQHMALDPLTKGEPRHDPEGADAMRLQGGDLAPQRAKPVAISEHLAGLGSGRQSHAHNMGNQMIDPLDSTIDVASGQCHSVDTDPAEPAARALTRWSQDVMLSKPIPEKGGEVPVGLLPADTAASCMTSRQVSTPERGARRPQLAAQAAGDGEVAKGQLACSAAGTMDNIEAALYESDSSAARGRSPDLTYTEYSSDGASESDSGQDASSGKRSMRASELIQQHENTALNMHMGSEHGQEGSQGDVKAGPMASASRLLCSTEGGLAELECTSPAAGHQHISSLDCASVSDQQHGQEDAIGEHTDGNKTVDPAHHRDLGPECEVGASGAPRLEAIQVAHATHSFVASSVPECGTDAAVGATRPGGASAPWHSCVRDPEVDHRALEKSSEGSSLSIEVVVATALAHASQCSDKSAPGDREEAEADAEGNSSVCVADIADDHAAPSVGTQPVPVSISSDTGSDPRSRTTPLGDAIASPSLGGVNAHGAHKSIEDEAEHASDTLPRTVASESILDKQGPIGNRAPDAESVRVDAEESAPSEVVPPQSVFNEQLRQVAIGSIHPEAKEAICTTADKQRRTDQAVECVAGDDSKPCLDICRMSGASLYRPPHPADSACNGDPREHTGVGSAQLARVASAAKEVCEVERSSSSYKGAASKGGSCTLAGQSPSSVELGDPAVQAVAGLGLIAQPLFDDGGGLSAVHKASALDVPDKESAMISTGTSFSLDPSCPSSLRRVASKPLLDSMTADDRQILTSAFCPEGHGDLRANQREAIMESTPFVAEPLLQSTGGPQVTSFPQESALRGNAQAGQDVVMERRDAVEHQGGTMAYGASDETGLLSSASGGSTPVQRSQHTEYGLDDLLVAKSRSARVAEVMTATPTD